MKPCARCQDAPRDTGPGRVYCNPCNALNVREWYDAHPGMRTQRAHESKYALRAEALMRYGRICACCGEERREFLALDHINGDGAEHRRGMPRGGLAVPLDLKRRGWPDGIQILCHNCNSAKQFEGICPHVFDKAEAQAVAAGYGR